MNARLQALALPHLPAFCLPTSFQELCPLGPGPWSTLAALSVWVLRLKGELPWALRKLQL